MRNKFERERLLRSTILAGAVAAFGIASAPAFAQDADDDETSSPERILVTGSRLLSNQNLTSANPVLTVTAEEVDIRGNTRIEDFINILPQVFAGQASEVSNGASGTATLNLRGLGSVRTLVLIDGRRLPYGSSQISSANLDLIPAQLVERVEILTGGASAVYGSDAVGGVANFILRDDFEGVELDIQAGIAHNTNGVEPWDSVLSAAGIDPPGVAWDGEEYTLSMIIGANAPNGRGNVTLFASYANQEQITQDDRSISGCALGQADGPNTFGGFGCVGSANFRAFGGAGGFGFQEEDGTIVPFAGGPTQTYNFGPRNFFQRPAERLNLYASGHYEISDNIEAFADISFVNNRSDAQIAETASFGSWSINCDNPFIQATPGLALTDLFGCTADDIANGTIIPGLFASHRNIEGGPRNSNLENSAWRVVSGLRGTFADHWGWEAFFQYSRTDDVQTSTNDFIVGNVQQAFLVTTDADGNPVCIDPTGGCVPYNIFQRTPSGESLVTEAMTDYLQGVGIITGETDQFLWGANIQADLGNYGVQSPFANAGVGFLVGFEMREDTLDRVPDEIFQVPGGGFTGLGGATLPVSGRVEVGELFTELQVPIVTDRPFFDELVLSGQYRYSEYTNSGNGAESEVQTDSYALQLTWAPVEDVRLRAQFQRAVRAPNVIELFTGQDVGLPNLSPAGVNANGVQLFDPCASDAPLLSQEVCARTGVSAAQYGTILDVISGQTQGITGGNPALDPESSDTITIGAVFQPSMIPNFSASVDYFDITVDNAISGGIGAQTILDECLATGDPAFCNLVTRAPNGTLASGFGVDYGFLLTNVNIAELTTQGFDLQVLYSFGLDNLGINNLGDIRFDYAATILEDLTTVPFPGADPIECAGLFGAACGTPNPEYRHRFLTTWATPWNWEATATWRYFGGTDNDNASDTLEPSLDSINYLDLSGNIQLTDNVLLRGGVLNVLNAETPVFSGAGPALGNGNTYPTVYDTGRFLFGSVTLTY